MAAAALQADAVLIDNKAAVAVVGLACTVAESLSVLEGTTLEALPLVEGLLGAAAVR